MENKSYDFYLLSDLSLDDNTDHAVLMSITCKLECKTNTVKQHNKISMKQTPDRNIKDKNEQE